MTEPPASKRMRKGRDVKTTTVAKTKVVNENVWAPKCLLKVNPQTRTLTGHRGGYKTARGATGVSAGTWYFEIEVMRPLHPKGHVRLGWTTKYADLEYPVGFAEDSYGVRDVDGSKIALAYRQKYMDQGFGWRNTETEEDAGARGDVVGCLLRLPEVQDVRPMKKKKEDPSVREEEKKKEFAATENEKNGSVKQEEVTGGSDNTMTLSSSSSSSSPESTSPTKVEGGEIRFFVNGKDCGPAFTDVRYHRHRGLGWHSLTHFPSE
eukprot:g447.t1